MIPSSQLQRKRPRRCATRWQVRRGWKVGTGRCPKSPSHAEDTDGTDWVQVRGGDASTPERETRPPARTRADRVRLPTVRIRSDELPYNKPEVYHGRQVLESGFRVRHDGFDVRVHAVRGHGFSYFTPSGGFLMDRDTQEKIVGGAFTIIATGWIAFTLYVVAVCQTSHLHW